MNDVWQYVGNHLFDIIHVLANIAVVLWALLRQADKIIVNHINNELHKVFWSKEDGLRLERKLDVTLRRFKYVKEELRKPKARHVQ